MGYIGNMGEEAVHRRSGDFTENGAIDTSDQLHLQLLNLPAAAGGQHFQSAQQKAGVTVAVHRASIDQGETAAPGERLDAGKIGRIKAVGQEAPAVIAAFGMTTEQIFAYAVGDGEEAVGLMKDCRFHAPLEGTGRRRPPRRRREPADPGVAEIGDPG